MVNPTSASLASLNIMTIVLVTSDYGHNAGPGFKGLQYVFGLEPSCTGNDYLLHTAGPIEVGYNGPSPAG
jgi:hypothetical protein